jgi:putative PIN family toxin of toxin-antitoxin system
MIRIVIDANVLISAAFGGTPLDAVGKAFSTGEVLLSPDVIKEIDGTIHRLSPKLGVEKTEFLLKLWRKLASRCTVLEAAGKGRICRDPKDDAYLHLCIAAKAEFLITGDKDLLAVDPKRVAALPDRLRIVTPRQFLEIGELRETPEPGRP